MLRPKLEKASFSFCQEGNTTGTTDEVEYITIEAENLILNERNGECFFVIKTDGWSIDDIEELADLINNIKSAVTELDK